jgi:hypothetical protein
MILLETRKLWIETRSGRKNETFSKISRIPLIVEPEVSVPPIAAACRHMSFTPFGKPSWSREIYLRYGFASKWSERHAAYVSGLGTFSLCDGLITPVGIAIRYGSVVSRIPIQPASRPYGSSCCCLVLLPWEVREMHQTMSCRGNLGTSAQ